MSNLSIHSPTPPHARNRFVNFNSFENSFHSFNSVFFLLLLLLLLSSLSNRLVRMYKKTSLKYFPESINLPNNLT